MNKGFLTKTVVAISDFHVYLLSAAREPLISVEIVFRIFLSKTAD
jgi:hypothetical protein